MFQYIPLHSQVYATTPKTEKKEFQSELFDYPNQCKVQPKLWLAKTHCFSNQTAVTAILQHITSVAMRYRLI